jgi:hypothetical protein
MRGLVSTLGLILCLGGSAWAVQEAPTVPTADDVQGASSGGHGLAAPA